MLSQGTAPRQRRPRRLQLFGITSRDPMPYGVAALLMIAVVGLASLSPAVAATRVDAIEVLRSE
ncbi:MAG: hypothetical protein ABIT71_17410 [Vicinamibacteraceae bacterium]